MDRNTENKGRGGSETLTWLSHERMQVNPVCVCVCVCVCENDVRK